MPAGICPQCGSQLDSALVLAGEQYHPGCEQPNPNTQLQANLLSDIVDIIQWTDNNSARSTQATIGPSELGGQCDRKIAYRLAGTVEVNFHRDPLPAIVGTAIHAWLEKAITNFQAVHYMDRWMTEVTVHPDPIITGHCDLYDKELECVIDFKTVSPTKLKEWKSKGPSEAYQDQVNLYAKGLARLGHPVKKVALIAVPRSGWLSEIQVWADDYRPERAQACLDRMYGIADKLIKMGDNLAFREIPASPERACSYCPWYRGGTKDADLSGCAGNAVQSRGKFGKGLVKDV